MEECGLRLFCFTGNRVGFPFDFWGEDRYNGEKKGDWKGGSRRQAADSDDGHHISSRYKMVTHTFTLIKKE